MMQELFDFDGRTYDSKRDKKRLNIQFHLIFKLMSDSIPRTLEEIQKETGFNVSSISARLRDFRKDKFGNHSVIRTHIKNGLFSYQLIQKERAPD